MSVVPRAHASASLYVGDLTSAVTEANLFEFFSQVGHIASIRVCRDHLTKRSLGYAYVNFHQVSDAERAMDTLNNSLIKGKPCRIMWCQRDPSTRRSGVGNVFIKSLDPTIGHKELYDTFSMFGNILSCKVALDENGNSKGFGFVQFETPEAATLAIEQVNDKLLKSKKVYVGKFESKKERYNQKEWTNVYVKDIDPAITEEELIKAYSAHGKVTNGVIMKKDGVSLGFGFVNFQDHPSAVKAVTALHGTPLGKNGKAIWCARAQKKSEREAELKKKYKQLKRERITKYSGINLYIKNLDDDVKEDQLRQHFSPFGKIQSLKIMTDEKKNSKGFGFVCFETPEQAQQAIHELNNRPLPGSLKPLYVALHEPKEIRRQKLAQEQLQRKQNPRANILPVYPPAYGYPPNTTSPQYSVIQPPMVRQQPSRWTQPPPYQSVPYAQPPGSGPQQRQPRTRPPVARPKTGIPTRRAIDGYPQDQQKLIIGEALYPLIVKKQPERAGKITGMLLDAGWDIDELYSLLENEEKLNQKIHEAVTVLDKDNS
jgi:polyadenylate-binding protein